MSRILNGEDMTFIGTVEQLAGLMGLLRDGATVANLGDAKLIVVKEPITVEQLRALVGKLRSVRILTSS